MDKPTFEILPASEWQARHYSPHYVSASQIPTILGLNRYCSAYTLHQRLTSHLPLDNRDTFRLRVGHHMESFLAEEYQRETGRPIENPGETAIVSHPDMPWFYATLDRIAFDGRTWGVIEMKTTEVYTPAARDWRNAEPPIEAQAQVQTQMLLSVLPWGALLGCVGLGSGGLINVPVQPHKRMQGIILSAAQEWKWRLDTDTAPPIDGSASTSEAVKEMAGLADNEEVVAPVELHDVAGRAYAEMCEARTNEAAWKDKADACQNQFVEWIGPNAGMQFGGLLVRRPNIVRGASITIPLKGLSQTEVETIEADLEGQSIDYKVTPASTYRRFYWKKEDI